jgi:general secretion pathway protein K
MSIDNPSHSQNVWATKADGFILVAVIWIISALSALASIYLIFIVNTAAGMVDPEFRVKRELLISAAIEMTARLQLNAPSVSRPSRGKFDFRLNNASVRVAYCSEAARIDLNAAPPPLLISLFQAVGASQEQAQAYSETIIHWRTPGSNQDSSSGKDAASVSPRSAGPHAQGRGGKFPHVNELSSLAIPKQLVRRVIPLTTVFSGRPQVNVFDATPQVLAALPGMTPENLKALLTQRNSPSIDRQALIAALGPGQQFATSESSKAIRASVRVEFERGPISVSEVVFLLFDVGSDPYAILSWTEDVNELGIDL